MARARSHRRSADLPGLAELVDCGPIVPAARPRRIAEVLADHPPVKLATHNAGTRALQEQRSERD
jgi:hypothetical protein